jgi:hypothetical protein
MSERDPVRRRVFGSLLMNAVLRWESLVTLVITMILFFAVPSPNIFGIVLPAWAWLIMGGMAESALVLSALTDPEEAQQAMAKEFESKYDLAHIRNANSRDRLRTAMDYRRNMLRLLKQHSGGMRQQLNTTVSQVNDWIARMYDIAQHIDSFETNELVERDIRMVPQQIEKVKTRIERESDERVKQDLERQLKQLELQRMNLEQTKNTVKRAEIQLESTLSSLGTVYAQMSLLGTKGSVDSGQGHRIGLEIQDEVNSLQDTIDAMDEIQLQSLRLSE